MESPVRFAVLFLGLAWTGCDRVFGLALDRPDGAPDVLVSEDAYVCTAPVVIDDRFDNADLATAGPLSTSPGFEAVTNAIGNGSSIERPGGALELRTSNNTVASAPVQGIATKTKFAFSPTGMTVRLEVTASDTPRWNGIALALQSDQTNLDMPGTSLVLRIRGPQVHPFTVDVGNQDPYGTPLSLDAYDEPALVDGFTVVWHLDATSWSYVIDGLRSDGTVLSRSGNFLNGQTPADLLGSDAYLAIHIQGTSPDVNQRILNVRRVTVWDGTCY